MQRFKRLLTSWEALLVLVFVLIMVLGGNLSPYFLTGYNFSSLSSNIMERALIALPMTLIIIEGEIDLSVASILGLCSVVLGTIWASSHQIWLAISGALLIGAIAGFINGFCVVRLGLPSLVVTLGTMALYRGLAYVIMGSGAVSNFPGSFTQFGFGVIPGTLLPWSVLIFALLAIIFIVALHWSRWGRQIYAIGHNKEAARFAGIQVEQLKFTLFILSGIICALAGIILTARISSARPDNALGFELDVITMVLLGGVSINGGRGTLPGVVLAIFIVAMVRNMLGLLYISGDIQNFVAGLLLVVSVLLPNIIQRIQGAIAHRRSTGDRLKQA
jgi:rhamnose transport system permease protein